MDDFTLEELGFLERAVYIVKLHNSGTYGFESDYLYAIKLEQKIKSMINSYDDKLHTFRFGLNNDKCMKCNLDFNSASFRKCECKNE